MQESSICIGLNLAYLTNPLNILKALRIYTMCTISKTSQDRLLKKKSMVWVIFEYSEKVFIPHTTSSDMKITFVRM